ncbi:hypothetical protein M3J09_007597 [Ascochyta lentis]
MTTATQALPALEVSAPDADMDVLSDTGFDFGDGDIDLDLDTAPSVHDEDISLNDAATDGGIDIQELPTDQDDFMADHGDLIEEDDMYTGGDATAAVSQSLDDGTVTFEADMLAPPDEDLIDYSDDEALQPVKMQSPSVHEADEDVQLSYNIEAVAVTPQEYKGDVHTHEEEQPLASAEASQGEVQSHQDDIIETHARYEKSPSVSSEHHSQDATEPKLDGNDEDQVHVDDNGGVQLPAEETSHSDDDAAVEQQENAHQNVVDEDDIEQPNVQQIELRPVTVNYAGNELWLFKQHDLDESGDFLLEDLSAATSGMSDLFQACRSSLGDDVSSEHEIGFRFDHLHNLELYEDNTACVAVSLERLVDLYHTLQAQDGVEDPECFYVTLQFRPRFATLLADVAQYAEQGSGYSALDAAVTAGETHFSNVFSSASTEHGHIEWDDEENNNEEASSPSSIHSNAPREPEVSEAIEPLSEDAQDNEEDREDREDREEHEEHSNHNDAEQDQGADLAESLQKEPITQEEHSHVVEETANIVTSESTALNTSTGQAEVVQEPEAEEAVGRQASESRDERTPDQIAHDKQEAEDFVDYSDDEDNQETKSPPAREPSPSSSTVQGDESTETQEPGDVSEHDGDDDENTAETGFEEHDDDATLLTQTQYGDDANHYAFQDYAETYDQGTYDQGDPFQDFQADGTVGDPFEGNDAFNGDTNQDFADYNFQTLEGEVDLDFGELPLDNANSAHHTDGTFAADENVTGADTFLDLDNAPEWAIDADPASNMPGEDAVLVHDDATHEDESGETAQSTATTSTAADPAPTLSTEHNPSSPQGQKRSIDEVGDGIDDAPDSTEAKRLRV